MKKKQLTTIIQMVKTIDYINQLINIIFLNLIGGINNDRTQIYENIKQAISSASRNSQTMEMHLQMTKYVDHLKNVTAKEFCEGVGLKASFGTEFSKMRNLTQRLKAAGLDTTKL